MARILQLLRQRGHGPRDCWSKQKDEEYNDKTAVHAVGDDGIGPKTCEDFIQVAVTQGKSETALAWQSSIAVSVGF